MFNKYAKYYDKFYQNKPYRKEIEFVYKWADKPKTILDIGCGTANYWKYYPEDTEILGIEQSVDMVFDSPNKHNIILHTISDTAFCYMSKRFDCVTALYDVINYLPHHNWWAGLPLKKGGSFIFDIWDKTKVDRDGFRQTVKGVAGIIRIINPMCYDGKEVKLNITIANKDFEESELHTLYVYSEADIKKFCGKEFEIVDKKNGKDWQVWYRLQKR